MDMDGVDGTSQQNGKKWQLGKTGKVLGQLLYFIKWMMLYNGEVLPSLVMKHTLHNQFKNRDGAMVPLQHKRIGTKGLDAKLRRNWLPFKNLQRSIEMAQGASTQRLMAQRASTQ